MRRHIWSRASVLVAFALIAVACGEKGTSVPGVTSPTIPPTTGPSPLALARAADTLAVDESLQLSAIIPPLPGAASPSISWASSDENVAIVTPNGVLFALKSGKTTVTVTSRGASASTTVTVRPTIRDISFDSDSLAISLSDSVQLDYRVTDSDGQPVDLSSHRVEWSSTSPDVAPLTGNATITGLALGRTDVKLTVDNKVGTTTVRVLPRPVAAVRVSPASVALLVGQSLRLDATSTDVHGNVLTGRVVTWSSSNPVIATVGSAGLVKAVAPGKADITVNVEGKKVVVPVTVTSSTTSGPAPVASATVTLNAASVVAGQSTQANVVLKDASSTTLTGRTIVWASSDPTLAAVTATGYVTGIKSGTATISAMSEGVTGSAVLTVTAPATQPPAVATVSVALSSASTLIGQTSQATATLKDAAGAVLTAPAVSWVSSDATVASVDASGLVTSLKAGSVTITASSNGKSGSAKFTATAPTAAVHMISLATNAPSVKIGQLTQATGVVRDITGAPITSVPIVWSASPMSVATISTGGMIAGRGVGTATIYAKADSITRSITIVVLDSATATTPTTPTPIPSVPVGATGPTYGTAQMAELPRLTVATGYPSVTRQVPVPAGANLQAALNAAQPGDELLLAPGARYVGNFVLPTKPAGSAWIVVRTDVPDAALGAAGTRMTPTRAAAVNLAQILTPNGQPALDTQLGTHHYRLTGVEIGATTSAVDINAIVRFGIDDYTQNSAATTANHLIVDRSYVHGAATLEVRRCVLLNSATSAVVDSWLADCHSNVSDSQAIVSWNGPGPFLIQNNHLEAGHEVVVFGGGTFTVAGGSPSDITIRGNHITRPLAWKGIWQVKNLLETKHVKRLLIEGNVFENNWADAQAGFAFVLKSENQQNDNPWTQSADITIRYNRIRNTGNVWNLAENPSGRPALPAARMVITDNIVENVNVAPYLGDGHTLQLLGGLQDIVMMHNTVLSAAGGNAFAVVFGQLPTVQRLVVHSNVLQHGSYGMKGGGVGEGTSSINLYAPGSLITNNAIAGGGQASAYPVNNFFPSTTGAIGFANLLAGDLRLLLGSPYAGKGYDGREIGADQVQVDNMTRNAVVAP
jgi:uncharacterized protein YjdB